MPFKKIGKNKNISPSGRIFTDKQVKLYYATDGFKNMDEEEKKGTKPKMLKKDLIEEVISEMSEEEDYLNETINRKINKEITIHINNWLVKKLENNE